MEMLCYCSRLAPQKKYRLKIHIIIFFAFTRLLSHILIFGVSGQQIFSANIGESYYKKLMVFGVVEAPKPHILRPYILNGWILLSFFWYNNKKHWCVIINLIQFSLNKHLTTIDKIVNGILFFFISMKRKSKKPTRNHPVSFWWFVDFVSICPIRCHLKSQFDRLHFVIQEEMVGAWEMSKKIQ